MDKKSKKQALQMLSNGLYVVTSRKGDEYGIATVSWVSQISFHPPLVMVALNRQSHVFKCISASRVAALNILATAQQDIAGRFIQRTKTRDTGFNETEFEQGAHSVPILRNAPAYLECQVHEIMNGKGDHAVVIMEVKEAECRDQAIPLTVADSPWKYGG